MDKSNVPYSLGIITLAMLIVTTPAFAEVTSLQTNSPLFYKGGQIEFSGTVEKGSTGLVTIVIRDLNDEFVMLKQALINPDNSFEKTIEVNDKFSEYGAYNATGFILNMAKGVTTNFEVSLNGFPTNQDERKTNIQLTKESSTLKQETSTKEDTAKESSPSIEQNIAKETKTENTIITTQLADFVDPSKDPQHYIDRYYNEESYKSWFDRNYPELTIEEAIGYTDKVEEMKSTVHELIDKEIIPEAQASSIVEPIHQSNNNSETAQAVLAIMGLAILFGAVYGIKRKVDDNSKQISINRETLRKKLIDPFIGTNPKDILKTRLAKGEITLDEYEKIKSKLY